MKELSTKEAKKLYARIKVARETDAKKAAFAVAAAAGCISAFIVFRKGFIFTGISFAAIAALKLVNVNSYGKNGSIS